MDIKQHISETYIKGRGIEIGALHRPFPALPGTQVTYVDRLSEQELRKQYPELAGIPFAQTGIIDDGETLAKISDNSQDFVIASHFLEHCQDPIKAIENMVRVTAENGIIYIAVPDMRYTFDVFRPVTPLSHLIQDHEEGAAGSAESHYCDYAKYVSRCGTEEAIASAKQNFMTTGYSIHFHAWRQYEMLELIAYLGKTKKMPILCEEIMRGENDCNIVLRKMSAIKEYDDLAAQVRDLDTSGDQAENVFNRKLDLGKGFAALQQHWAAASLFSEALALRPDSVDALVLSALAQINLSQLNVARKNLIKAQKLDPANEVVRKLLSTLDTHASLLVKSKQ